MDTASPSNADVRWVRYLGLVTAISLAVFLVAIYVLPILPGVIVGGTAALVAIGGGAQFVFFGSTLISRALEGKRRTQFQVAISLAAPLVFALCLASRVDALPIETLWRMMTPWLLIPLCVLGWVGWFSATQLDRDHPFRGYLIGATVLFVLCFLWSMGMTSESDPSGEGSYSYFDRDQAMEARQSGRYVFMYAIYTAALYVAMFLRSRLKPRESTGEEALRKLNEALTPDAVEDIVSKMNHYIVARHARHGREADLPVPKVAIEIAYLKVMSGCSDPTRLELLKATYLTLDDYMLSEQDCAALDDFDKAVDQATEGRIPDTQRMSQALGVKKRLTEAMHRRSQTIAEVIKK